MLTKSCLNWTIFVKRFHGLFILPSLWEAGLNSANNLKSSIFAHARAVWHLIIDRNRIVVKILNENFSISVISCICGVLEFFENAYEQEKQFAFSWNCTLNYHIEYVLKVFSWIVCWHISNALWLTLGLFAGWNCFEKGEKECWLSGINIIRPNQKVFGQTCEGLKGWPKERP